MMMFILDFDIYTFGVVLIKCFGLLLSLREEESMGEWRKKEVVKYSSPLSLFYHFPTNSLIRLQIIGLEGERKKYGTRVSDTEEGTVKE